MSRCSTGLACTIALTVSMAVPPSTVRAQGASRIPTGPSPRLRLAVGGGVAQSAPFGGAEMGYTYTGAVEVRTPIPGLRIRTDAFLANWGGNQQLASLSLGVAVRAPEHWRIAPAVFAMAGGYRPSRSGRLSAGWSLGAGLRVPLSDQALLIETRAVAFKASMRDLANAGVRPIDLAYTRWQYTYMPLVFSVQF